MHPKPRVAGAPVLLGRTEEMQRIRNGLLFSSEAIGEKRRGGGEEGKRMGIARSSCRRPWESVGRNAGGKGEAREGEARCSVLQGIPASHSSLLGDLALFCLFFILIFGLFVFLILFFMLRH